MEKRIVIESAGLTHIGKVREENQDSMHVNNKAALYIVADGMGGMQDGKKASQTAIKVLAGCFRRNRPETLLAGTIKAHTNISKRNEGKKNSQRMGTTLTALHISPAGKAHIIHVGDSRVYRLRGNELQQVTTDHDTAVEVGKALGWTQDMVQNSPLHGVLTQAIGLEKMKPEEITEDTQNNDTYLVCSDGLTKHVTDKEIKAILQENIQAHGESAKKLIALANARGGTDNITAIVAKVKHETIPVTSVRRLFRRIPFLKKRS